jgi:hypothetical protein
VVHPLIACGRNYTWRGIGCHQTEPNRVTEGGNDGTQRRADRAVSGGGVCGGAGEVAAILSSSPPGTARGRTGTRITRTLAFWTRPRGWACGCPCMTPPWPMVPCMWSRAATAVRASTGAMAIAITTSRVRLIRSATPSCLWRWQRAGAVLQLRHRPLYEGQPDGQGPCRALPSFPQDMVLCLPEGAWSEALPEATLQCTDPELRNWERTWKLLVDAGADLGSHQAHRPRDLDVGAVRPALPLHGMDSHGFGAVYATSIAAAQSLSQDFESWPETTSVLRNATSAAVRERWGSRSSPSSATLNGNSDTRSESRRGASSKT